MKKTDLEKVKDLVHVESSSWLLNQFSCDEENIFISEALRELLEDRELEVSIETLTVLVNELNKDII